MADALVSSLVSEILRNLTSVAAQEFGIFWGLKTDLRALQSTFSTIQAVLQDAEVKQRKSKALQDWLRKLKGASVEVENVLDEISTEAGRRRLDKERGVKLKNQVSLLLSIDNPLVFRARMAHKVKDARERLDSIAAERSKFELREGVSDFGVGGDMGSRLSSSLVTESEILGRDEEKEMIVDRLLSNLGDQDDDVHVYAIWGMGGIGKTTLAQLVYNHERVKLQFELKIWVCVSDDFDILRLTRAILEDIEGSPCNISELNPLQRRLQEKLRGRRFLLVLDDVWNDDRAQWEGLREALRCGLKGSMIIVTTRSKEIVDMMAKLPESVHQIGCLSEDASWSLFKRLAFGAGRTEENIIESWRKLGRR